jgi:hypothetical protein
MLNVHHMKSTENPAEATDPLCPAFVSGRPREDQVVGSGMHAAVEALRAVDHPVVSVTDRLRFQPRGVGPVVRLRQPERHASLAGEHPLEELLLLLLAAIVLPHLYRREVADDRRLVLQVVVQPQPLRRQVLPHDRHRQVRPGAPAVFLRNAVAQEACFVGANSHLSEQVFPLLARHAAVLEVRPLVFSPVVEKADVVVLLLQRLDLRLDELIQVLQQLLDILRYIKIHLCSPRLRAFVP